MALSYRGKSMKGTFKKEDFLLFKPCIIKKLRRGDIVVFKKSNGLKANVMIVHRIIQINNNVLFTHGDNKKRPDVIPVSKANLLGKVTAYERNSKRYRVIGGMPGLIIARIRYFFRRSAYRFFTKIKWILSTKVISDNINRFWEHRIQKLKVNTKEGPVIKWIYRNHTIAEQLPDNTLQRFSILSYFLTETKNPSITSDSSS